MNALLIIDPQNDFCHPDGALYVPGAQEDCARLAEFVRTNEKNIQSIFLTEDCHPYYHIAHPAYWKTSLGTTPSDFTSITYEDVMNGRYIPSNPDFMPHVEYYLQNLEARGRYTLTLWPPHCLQGSVGVAVEKNVWDAVHAWEKGTDGKNITYIEKSPNQNTEHYSCVQAEVPDANDPSTCTNYNFINALKEESSIFIAGQALSHCVANTIRDLSLYIPLSNMTLLTDCCSPIPGFEYLAEDFIAEMTARGMHTAVSTEVCVYATR